MDPTLLGLAFKPGPKHFQKEPTSLGLVAQQDPIVLGLAQPNPKHFKKGVGLVAQLDPSILSLGGQLDPITLGLAVQPYLMILLFVL
jgi:hypothetical protein